MIEALFLAVALAMDAFAVALVQGARVRPAVSAMFAIALTFGLAQGLMALIGWGLGEAMLPHIEAFDHWISCALLTLIGVQMIRAGDHEEAARPLRAMSLLAAAIATSLDAFAAGITLPMLETPPLVAAGLIAFVTLALSLAGVRLGRVAGERYGRPAEMLGGIILIALGCTILATHTGLL